MTLSVPTVALNNGITMPQIGFGVFRIPDADTERTVRDAIECGYRSIDTASLYGNEPGVGKAVAGCGLSREDLFVTTKLWNDDQGRGRAKDAFDASLDRLGLDYVDLYLIHWPKPSKNLYVETWQVLQELYATGHARVIGVSNFQPGHLDALMSQGEVIPAANQIELHPLLQQEPLRRYDADHGIVTVAWSPLGQRASIEDPVIDAIAQRYGRTPAQIILRWHLQLGNVVIPKSSRPIRMRGESGHSRLLSRRRGSCRHQAAGYGREVRARPGRAGPGPRRVSPAPAAAGLSSATVNGTVLPGYLAP